MSVFNFKFDLPVPGWQDQTIYAFKGPTIDDLDHFIMIAVDRDLETPSLEAYARERTALITSSLQNAEILKQAAISLGGRLPAADLLLKWSISAQIARYKRYVFLISNKMGFTISCDFSKDSYGQLNTQVTEVATALFAPVPQSPEDHA